MPDRLAGTAVNSVISWKTLSLTILDPCLMLPLSLDPVCACHLWIWPLSCWQLWSPSPHFSILFTFFTLHFRISSLPFLLTSLFSLSSLTSLPYSLHFLAFLWIKCSAKRIFSRLLVSLDFLYFDVSLASWHPFVFQCAAPPRCTRWHPPHLMARCLPCVCWCSTAKSNHRPGWQACAHPDYTLQWRARPGETEHEPRPSHDKRGSPPSTPGATLCEKTRGFVRFQSSEPHLDAANPLPSASIALQIMTTASTTSAINSMDAAIFHCDLHTRFLLYNFTVEDASGRNRAWAAPVAQLRVRPSTPGATLCEKTWGFVRFQTSEHHLYAANLLPFASVALQITLQLRWPHRQSTTWMQPFHCYLRTRNLLY